MHMFEDILVIDNWRVSHENSLMWISIRFTDNKSPLIQQAIDVTNVDGILQQNIAALGC